mmetsp:Transcript_113748/g.200763  ORF Transcript_113748/g.200763 Transcript_113748/m.200763 type:complete len:261 (+) Transcript_113748:31-813(+)
MAGHDQHQIPPNSQKELATPNQPCTTVKCPQHLNNHQGPDAEKLHMLDEGKVRATQFWLLVEAPPTVEHASQIVSELVDCVDRNAPQARDHQHACEHRPLDIRRTVCVEVMHHHMAIIGHDEGPNILNVEKRICPISNPILCPMAVIVTSCSHACSKNRHDEHQERRRHPEAPVVEIWEAQVEMEQEDREGNYVKQTIRLLDLLPHLWLEQPLAQSFHEVALLVEIKGEDMTLGGIKFRWKHKRWHIHSGIEQIIGILTN